MSQQQRFAFEAPFSLPDPDAIRNDYLVIYKRLLTSRNRDFSGIFEQTADLVWQATLAALTEETDVQHVVCAETGAAKTTAALALLSALAKHGMSASIVCDNIRNADGVFHELRRLVEPQTVGIWTTAHALEKSDEEILAAGYVPSAHRFSKDMLAAHRLAVVTHAFVNHPSNIVVLNYQSRCRHLQVIDERPEVAQITSTTIGHIATARSTLMNHFGSSDLMVAAISNLLSALEGLWHKDHSGKQFDHLPPEELAAIKLQIEPLLRYDRSALDQLLGGHSYSDQAPLRRMFAFARNMSAGRIILDNFKGKQRGNIRACDFVTFEKTRAMSSPTIILDATGAIDGWSAIDDSRKSHKPLIRPDFGNLSIHQTEPPQFRKPHHTTKAALAQADNARTYSKWVTDYIISNTDEGEFCLAVVHKIMIDNGHFPSDTHLPGCVANIAGRFVYFAHWGDGIGTNLWKDCTTVFLFDEFHLPRATYVAQVHALSNRIPDAESLGDADFVNTQHFRGTFRAVKAGHLKRWVKQMAMRGNARNWNGMTCGSMRLFVVCPLTPFIDYISELFPGASVSFDATMPPEPAVSTNITAPRPRGAKAIARLLLTADETCLTSGEIQARTGVDMSRNSGRLLKNPLLVTAMAFQGWQYVHGKPSRMERKGP